jgi:dTDP-4-dehydrorhamnose 3,5-epimerase
MWIPVGFAHGFFTLSDSAQFLYKTTNYYSPEHERCIAWDDPALGIDWQLGDIGIPSLSAKDQVGKLISNI